jgi:phosphoglycolate phosphatase
MEVFTWSATISGELAARIEAELTDQEVAAVATAESTPYVHEVIAACRASGRSLTVVSNNSARAVSTYLTHHGLADRIQLVIARTSHDPALLKPSPHLIQRAVDTLGADARECVLVGDSTTDIEAAGRSTLQSFGYANKPGKRERLVVAGADAVVSSLSELVPKIRLYQGGQDTHSSG